MSDCEQEVVQLAIIADELFEIYWVLHDRGYIDWDTLSDREAARVHGALNRYQNYVEQYRIGRPRKVRVS